MKPSYRIAELERIGDAFRQRAIEAERERDEAIRQRDESGVRFHKAVQYGAEIERERDDLRSSQEHEGDCLIDALASRDEWRLRAVTAEAEIARRDAQAGEPVAYQIHSDLEGWRECTPERYAEVSARPLIDGKYSGGWLLRKLYTVAPPAVLPPKLSMEIDPELQGEFRVHEAIRRKGFNQALDAALEIGAQPQKPVVLPEPHAHLIWIQAGRGPDDYWDDVEVSRSDKDRCCDGSERYAVYSEFEVKAMLDAANIPYEVKP